MIAWLSFFKTLCFSMFYFTVIVNCKFQFFYEGRERKRESPTPDISLNPHMSMYQIFIHNNSVDFNPSNSRQNRQLVYLKIHELRLLFFVLYHCSQFTEPPIVYQKFYYIYIYVPFDQWKKSMWCEKNFRALHFMEVPSTSPF